MSRRSRGDVARRAERADELARAALLAGQLHVRFVAQSKSQTWPLRQTQLFPQLPFEGRPRRRASSWRRRSTKKRKKRKRGGAAGRTAGRGGGGGRAQHRPGRPRSSRTSTLKTRETPADDERNDQTEPHPSMIACGDRKGRRPHASDPLLRLLSSPSHPRRACMRRRGPPPRPQRRPRRRRAARRRHPPGAAPGAQSRPWRTSSRTPSTAP